MSYPGLLTAVKKGITFNSANGAAPTTTVAKVGIPELGDIVKAWVMERPPAVLALGGRVRKGFSFIWRTGGQPYFITPDNMIVVLDVVGDIPYFRPGSELCQPRQPGAEFLLNLLPVAIPTVRKARRNEAEEPTACIVVDLSLPTVMLICLLALLRTTSMSEARPL